MILVKDAKLKQMILLHLVELAERGDLSAFEENGISLDDVDALRSLPSDELVRLSELPLQIIQVEVDTSKLGHALRQLQSIRSEVERLSYFVEHGASLPMLRRLFRGYESEIEFFKSAFVDTKCGRPPMPPSQLRDSIHQAWHVLKRQAESTPLKSLYFQLHQAFPHVRLDQLDAVINEFDRS